MLPHHRNRGWCRFTSGTELVSSQSERSDDWPQEVAVI